MLLSMVGSRLRPAGRGALMAELAEGWQRTGTRSRVDEGIAGSNRACMQTWRPCGWFGALTHLGDNAADHTDPGGDGSPVVAQAPFIGRGLAGGHGWRAMGC